MIYGEEQKSIDFSRGLWMADDLDAIPDGYAANLVNLVPDEAGNLEIRPNFLPVINFGTVSFTLSNLTGISPDGNVVDNWSINSLNFAGFALDHTTTSGPSMAIFELEGTTLTCVYLNRGDTTWTVNMGAVAMLPLAFAQYRDRYYAIEHNGAYQSQIWYYNFGIGAIGRTSVGNVGSAQLGDLVTFRDRVFAFDTYTSRVYYTELAALGGYPENWNAGANFFDLPDSGAQIRRAFVANDRLYIFTTVGVYQLYASGAPSTWQVLPVTREITVKSRYDVEYIGGVFIITDRQKVYAYNGSNSIQDIGVPIEAALRSQVADYAIPLESSVQKYSGPYNVRFFPYQSGFIMGCYHLTYLNAGALQQVRSNKYYYFNGKVWSEIQFDTDLSGSNRGHYDLLVTGKTRRFRTSSTEGIRRDDVLVELRYNSSTTSVITAAKTIRSDNQDIDIGNFETKFALFTKDTEYEFPNMARFKEVRVDLRSSISSVTISPYVDGNFTSSYAPSLGTAGSHKLRVPVTRERGNSISVSISGALNKTTGPGGDQSLHTWPSFRLNRIMPVVNTDTRKLTDQDYAS